MENDKIEEEESPSLPGKPTKLTTIEIQERREKVYQLRLQGKALSEIATLLETSVMTIKRDLDIIKKENKDKLTSEQQDDIIAETLAMYDAIIAESWKEYSTRTPLDPNKLTALNTIRMTQNDKLRILEDVGLVKKESTKLEVVNTYRLPEWSPDLQKAVIQTLLNSKLSELENPIPEVEEVNPNIEPAIVVEDTTTEEWEEVEVIEEEDENG